MIKLKFREFINDCGIVNERNMIFELRLDAQKEDFLLCRNILLDIRAIVEKNFAIITQLSLYNICTD